MRATIPDPLADALGQHISEKRQKRIQQALGLFRGDTDLIDGHGIADMRDSQAITRLLLFATAKPCSEIMLKSDTPMFRCLHHRMTAITLPVEHEALKSFIEKTATKQGAVIANLVAGLDIDYAFSIPDPVLKDDYGQTVRHRFRVNVTACDYRGDIGFDVTMRYIPHRVPSPEDLGMEPFLVDNGVPERGATIFAGEVGSGKTSSLAALLRRVLEGRTRIEGHILTYEWPIEFVLDTIPSSTCQVAQQEIGLHLKAPYGAPSSFSMGVRNSLRRKAALVMVGEMRDYDTIAAGIEASNTGLPILTTTHANGVAEVVPRLVSRFPESRQNQAFYDILSLSHLFVAQRIAPKRGGGFICLREWQLFDSALRSTLYDVGPYKLQSELQKLVDNPANQNGCSMRQTVLHHYAKGLLEPDIAQWVLNSFNYRGVDLDKEAGAHG